MTQYEQLYYDLYKAIGANMLNTGDIVNSLKGIKHSQETRDKVSKAGRGRKCSEETRKKISLSQLGKIIPREIVEKANIAKRGRKMTYEQKIKSALARKGLKRKPETGHKISKALMGKVRTEDSKKRQSDSLKLNHVKYWQGKKLTKESIEKREATRLLNKINKQNAIPQ